MPIDATVVEKLLIENGFVSDNETQKKKRFYSNELDQYVYINKTSGESDSTLIIHPDYKDRRDSFLLLEGVHSNDVFYHASNIGKFPKRKNNGETPISYGIPFGFQDSIACKRFLNKLNQQESVEFMDELDDIENANKSVSVLNETERKAVIKSRIGQGLFRELLIQKWSGCSITGLNLFSVLKASHIKPWRVCSNIERLDPYNGFLLTPNFDAAFDSGFISFTDKGNILISSKITTETREVLGINLEIKIKRIEDEHKKYLDYHRNNVFKC